MPVRNAIQRQAQVVGAQRAQRAFARYGQHGAVFETLAAFEHHHFAHKSGVRQQLQALFGLFLILAVPPPAAQHDERHQKQKPVPRTLRDDFVNGLRHLHSSFRRGG